MTNENTVEQGGTYVVSEVTLGTSASKSWLDTCYGNPLTGAKTDQFSFAKVEVNAFSISSQIRNASSK
jgi:hypothetical protein